MSDAAPAAHAWSCFGLAIESALPLPELRRLPAGASRPRVTIEIGAVPERLAGGESDGSELQVSGSAALLTVSHVARFLIDGGDAIVVAPEPGAAPEMVRLFLLGSALGIVCHRRGLLPLHANAVSDGHRGFAFAGPSGAGKSTLAAWFDRNGMAAFADDVCVIDRAPDGSARMWPGIPRAKLWADAAGVLGHDSAALDPVAAGAAKFHVPLSGPGEDAPCPLAGFYELGVCDEDEPSPVAPLRGVSAAGAYLRHTYRGSWLGRLGLAAEHFERCTWLASQVPVFRARRRWGLERLDAEASKLARHLAQARAA